MAQPCLEYGWFKRDDLVGLIGAPRNKEDKAQLLFCFTHNAIFEAGEKHCMQVALALCPPSAVNCALKAVEAARLISGYDIRAIEFQDTGYVRILSGNIWRTISTDALMRMGGEAGTWLAARMAEPSWPDAIDLSPQERWERGGDEE